MLVLAIVPLTLFTYQRAHGITVRANEYERFAQQLQREGPDVPAGGTLYLVGRPGRGPFSPDSHVQSLVGLYYDDINVVLMKPAEPVPALGPDDRVFTFTP